MLASNLTQIVFNELQHVLSFTNSVSVLDAMFCLQSQQMRNFGHGSPPMLLKKVCLPQIWHKLFLTNSNMPCLLLTSFLDAMFCLQSQQMRNFGHGLPMWLKKVCLPQLNCYLTQIVFNELQHVLSFTNSVSVLDAMFCLQSQQMRNFGHGSPPMLLKKVCLPQIWHKLFLTNSSMSCLLPILFLFLTPCFVYNHNRWETLAMAVLRCY